MCASRTSRVNPQHGFKQALKNSVKTKPIFTENSLEDTFLFVFRVTLVRRFGSLVCGEAKRDVEFAEYNFNYINAGFH